MPAEIALRPQPQLWVSSKRVQAPKPDFSAATTGTTPSKTPRQKGDADRKKLQLQQQQQHQLQHSDSSDDDNLGNMSPSSRATQKLLQQQNTFGGGGKTNVSGNNENKPHYGRLDMDVVMRDSVVHREIKPVPEETSEIDPHEAEKEAEIKRKLHEMMMGGVDAFGSSTRREGAFMPTLKVHITSHKPPKSAGGGTGSASNFSPTNKSGALSGTAYLIPPASSAAINNRPKTHSGAPTGGSSSTAVGLDGPISSSTSPKGKKSRMAAQLASSLDSPGYARPTSRGDPLAAWGTTPTTAAMPSPFHLDPNYVQQQQQDGGIIAPNPPTQPSATKMHPQRRTPISARKLTPRNNDKSNDQKKGSLLHYTSPPTTTSASANQKSNATTAATAAPDKRPNTTAGVGDNFRGRQQQQQTLRAATSHGDGDGKRSSRPRNSLSSEPGGPETAPSLQDVSSPWGTDNIMKTTFGERGEQFLEPANPVDPSLRSMFPRGGAVGGGGEIAHSSATIDEEDDGQKRKASGKRPPPLQAGGSGGAGPPSSNKAQSFPTPNNSANNLLSSSAKRQFKATMFDMSGINRDGGVKSKKNSSNTPPTTAPAAVTDERGMESVKGGAAAVVTATPNNLNSTRNFNREEGEQHRLKISTTKPPENDITTSSPTEVNLLHAPQFIKKKKIGGGPAVGASTSLAMRGERYKDLNIHIATLETAGELLAGGQPPSGKGLKAALEEVATAERGERAWKAELANFKAKIVHSPVGSPPSDEPVAWGDKSPRYQKMTDSIGVNTPISLGATSSSLYSLSRTGGKKSSKKKTTTNTPGFLSERNYYSKDEGGTGFSTSRQSASGIKKMNIFEPDYQDEIAPPKLRGKGWGRKAARVLDGGGVDERGPGLGRGLGEGGAAMTSGQLAAFVTHAVLRDAVVSDFSKVHSLAKPPVKNASPSRPSSARARTPTKSIPKSGGGFVAELGEGTLYRRRRKSIDGSVRPPTLLTSEEKSPNKGFASPQQSKAFDMLPSPPARSPPPTRSKFYGEIDSSPLPSSLTFSTPALVGISLMPPTKPTTAQKEGIISPKAARMASVGVETSPPPIRAPISPPGSSFFGSPPHSAHENAESAAVAFGRQGETEGEEVFAMRPPTAAVVPHPHPPSGGGAANSSSSSHFKRPTTSASDISMPSREPTPLSAAAGSVTKKQGKGGDGIRMGESAAGIDTEGNLVKPGAATHEDGSVPTTREGVFQKLQEEKVEALRKTDRTASPNKYKLGIRESKDFVPLGEGKGPRGSDLWAGRGGEKSNSEAPFGQMPAPGPQSASRARKERTFTSDEEVTKMREALEQAWSAVRDAADQRDLLAFQVAISEGKTGVLSERPGTDTRRHESMMPPPIVYPQSQQQQRQRAATAPTGPPGEPQPEWMGMTVDGEMAWGAKANYSETRASMRAADIVASQVGRANIHDLRRDRENIDKLQAKLDAMEKDLIRRTKEMEAGLSDLNEKQDKMSQDQKVLERKKREIERVQKQIQRDRTMTAKIQGSDVPINNLVQQLKVLTLENFALKDGIANLSREHNLNAQQILDQVAKTASDTLLSSDPTLSLGELEYHRASWNLNIANMGKYGRRGREGGGVVPAPPWVEAMMKDGVESTVDGRTESSLSTSIPAQ